MSKDVSKGKRLIRVPSDLVTKLSEAANREGKPFYDYTTEALEQAVRAHKMGASLRDVVDFYRVMEVMKGSGAVLVPRDTLNWLIERLHQEGEEGLMEVWRESGVWFGRYLTTKLHDEDPVEAFARVLKGSRWDLDEVMVEVDGGRVRLRCMSFTLSLESTKLLMSFVEGVMQSMGYRAVERDHMRGMITLEFERRKGTASASQG